MKIREVMSANPVCCLPTDSAQRVARIMCEHNIGSLPVVMDQESRKLVGVITDRDLCCSVVGDGLDTKTTKIEKFMTLNPVTCREEEDLENCERLMQEHQIRRIPIVDAKDGVIGSSGRQTALRARPRGFTAKRARLRQAPLLLSGLVP